MNDIMNKDEKTPNLVKSEEESESKPSEITKDPHKQLPKKVDYCPCNKTLLFA
jgi:hypothetical protein